MNLRRSARRGLSLLELLFVAFLFLLAMGMITTLFIYGSRAINSSTARTDQSMRRVEVSARLRQAMLSSYQSGNTVFYRNDNSDDLVMSLISSRATDGHRDWSAVNQRPVFHAYEVFYREPTDQSLRWHRYQQPPFEIARPLDPSSIVPLISSPNLKLLDSVTSFQLYAVADGTVRDGWANPLGVRLTQVTQRSTPIVTEISFKFVSP